MKLFKKLFKILLVIIIIIVLLLGTVVFLVYDNSLKENIYKDYPNDMNYEVNEIASNAIKDTKNTKIIDASLSEERINYLLQSITNTMNSEFNGKMNIKGATVKIDENSNTEISVYFKVFGFPSSLKGKFVLSENEESIDIQILNASIGKIKASQSTMGSLAKTFLNEKDIKKGLSDKGIKIDLEIEKLKVSVIKSEIPAMIKETLKDDPNNELYATLSSIVLENELLKIIATNHEIGADAHLEKLEYNNTFFYDIPYNFDYEAIKVKTETLLNSGIISYEKAGFIFDYLVRGYEKVTKNDENKDYDFIKSLDLTSIGIYSNKTYKGILEVPKKSMEEVILEQSPSLADLLSPSIDFKIYESDFNNILFNTGVIGISYAFARKENESYHVSYLYVESLYTHITDNKLEIIITLNINGLSIALKTSANALGDNGLAINTSVEGVDMGIISLKDEQITSILSYLDNALKDEEWIDVDHINKNINFNFTKLFTSSTTLNTLIEKASSTKCALYSAPTEGYIKISLSGLI